VAFRAFNIIYNGTPHKIAKTRTAAIISSNQRLDLVVPLAPNSPSVLDFPTVVDPKPVFVPLAEPVACVFPLTDPVDWVFTDPVDWVFN